MPGPSRWREALTNLFVSLTSFAILLCFCELVLFRLILPASDVPRNAFANDVVRYVPKQAGIWRIRDEIAAPFSINAQGWNSPVADYHLPSRSGVRRIAFVGDSFVEAFQVAVDKSMAEISLARLGGSFEGYRYGLSGAPMSQYVHMIEREVLAARPDMIVVLLIHNDFDESFLFRPGRYTSSFKKIRIESGKVTSEIAPDPWRPGLLEGLRQTAIARFFLYRWQVRPQIIVDAVLGTARADTPSIAANIDLGAIIRHEADIRVATDYIVSRLAAQASSIGASLLLAMDGDRSSIYAGRFDGPALMLNRIAGEAARRANVPFLDLHPVFAADWAKRRQRFEFDADAHWNENGHAVAGAAIAERLAGR